MIGKVLDHGDVHYDLLLHKVCIGYGYMCAEDVHGQADGLVAAGVVPSSRPECGYRATESAVFIPISWIINGSTMDLIDGLMVYSSRLCFVVGQRHHRSLSWLPRPLSPPLSSVSDQCTFLLFVLHDGVSASSVGVEGGATGCASVVQK